MTAKTPQHAPANAQTQGPDRSPRIIAVASGKGGVGKTWFASTFAHSLSFRGKRVLLFDGDLGLANVDVQLGLTPAHDLGSVMSGQVGLQEAVSPYHGGAGEKGGFDVLAGRSGSGALSMLKREDLVDLAVALKAVSQHYDHMVIDLSAGLDTAVITLSMVSDLILVVATDEPTSLTDAYAFIKIMLMRNPKADLRIVSNMADSVSAGRRTYETLAKACRTFLKAEPPLAGIVPRDPKVKEAIRRQSSVLSTYPQAQAPRAVDHLARALIPDPAAVKAS